MAYDSARYYDDIYAAAEKDYDAEVRIVQELVRQHKTSKGRRLLDVGCGTGLHASLLRRSYEVEGLDVDRKMLSQARKKNPGMRLHQADMAGFELPRKFDVITCLFSAIGYMRTRPRLRKAIQSMANHLLPGGVLLVEPWFTSKQWSVGHVGMLQVEKPGLKIVRMSRSSSKGKISILDFRYLVGTSKGIEYIAEKHELGLFEDEDYREAFQRAGLKVIHDTKGLDDRGLYIGIQA
jgi:SAM-dependent methyltransferase